MIRRRFGPIWPFKKRSPKPPRYRAHRGEQGRDRYDWITLWTAIIGVVIVAVSTGITAWQAVLTRQQLSALTLQQRPWVKVKVVPETDLIVGQFGAAMGFRVEAQNVGSLPALQVYSLDSRLYAFPNDHEATPGFSFPEACPNPAPYIGGVAVFPGETATLVQVPVWPSRAEVDTWESGGTIGFLITACVQYETPEGEIRQSGTLFSVFKERAIANIKSDTDHVKIEQIRILPLGTGDIAE